MAGGIGLGIGSFVDGLAKGMTLKRQFDKDDREAGLAERRMKLSENADVRADDESKFNQGMSTRRMAIAEADAKRSAADFDYQQKERAANAPILAAQRQNTLTGLQDQAAARSTMRDGAAKAAETAKATGGDFFDIYHRDVAPQIEQGYLARGDVNGAEGFRKWREDATVRRGIDKAGRVDAAIMSGDYDGAAKHFNDLVSSGTYLALGKNKVSVEPLKDQSGKSIGLRQTFTDAATGETRSVDLTDGQKLHQAMMGLISPAMAFEWNRKQLDAEQTAKLDAAKSKLDLGKSIAIEREKRAGQLDVEQLKQAGPEKVSEFNTAFKALDDAGAFKKKGGDGKPIEMTMDDKIAATHDYLQKAKVRSQTTRPQQQPSGPLLFNSRNPSAPGNSEQRAAVSPAMRSIFPMAIAQ